MSSKISIGVALPPTITGFFNSRADKSKSSFNEEITNALWSLSNIPTLANLIKEEKEDTFVNLKESPSSVALYLEETIVSKIVRAASVAGIKNRSEAIRLCLSYHIRQFKKESRKSLIKTSTLMTKLWKIKDDKTYEMSGNPDYHHEKVNIRKEGDFVYVKSIGGEFETPQTTWFHIDHIQSIPFCSTYNYKEITFKDLEKIAALAYEFVLNEERPVELKDLIGVSGTDENGEKWTI